jgi:class 3 adenylate cyclase
MPLDDRLPKWLTRERMQREKPPPALSWFRWAIRNPGQLWTVAAFTPFLVLPSLLIGSEILQKLFWAPEYVVLFMGAMTFGWGLRIQFAVATEEDRQRLHWIVEGLTLSMIVYACWTVLLLLTDLGPEGMLSVMDQVEAEKAFVVSIYVLISITVGPVVFTVLASLLATTFYKGAIDPRLAIRRTTVYGVLGVLFLFLFAGLGNVAEDLLEGALGIPTSMGSLIAGGTLAVVLIPVKRRMDRFMNRILPATVLAEGPRQEMTILFSDIVGYSALTGADQKAGLTVMSVFHKAADRVARENRGRFVKAVADEVMLEFQAPLHAVRAASQLQGEFTEAVRMLDLPVPDIRTGIHQGEAIRSGEGDLFGDAVNIASRVHGTAEPGQVVLSAAVAAGLGEGEFDLRSLGERELRNVAGVVELFCLQ